MNVCFYTLKKFIHCYSPIKICIWLKIETDLLKMLSAIVVAIFLAVPYWKAKYFTRVAVKKGGSSNAWDQKRLQDF